MRLWKAWIVAEKELAFMKSRTTIMIFIVGLPLALAMLLALVLYYEIDIRHTQVLMMTNLMGSFGFFFTILAGIIPNYLSATSIVMEKVEKSLEPLLATPTTDGEILIGKNIAAFIPTILSVFFSATVFMLLADAVTSGPLGYNFFPNLAFVISLFVATPLACIFSTGLSVFASSRAATVQSAYQLGVIPLIPLFAVYVLGEVGIVSLSDPENLWIISAGLFIAATFVFWLSFAKFDREEILTNWR